MTREALDSERIFLLHEFLSKDECAALIRASEGLTYETETVGGVVAESIRNNERVLVDDKALQINYSSVPRHGSHRLLNIATWLGSTSVGGSTAIVPDRRSSRIEMDRTCRLKPTKRVK